MPKITIFSEKWGGGNYSFIHPHGSTTSLSVPHFIITLILMIKGSALDERMNVSKFYKALYFRRYIFLLYKIFRSYIDYFP